MAKVKKIDKMFEMLDLFYANKHAHDRLKRQEKEKENFQEIFEKALDKLKHN